MKYAIIKMKHTIFLSKGISNTFNGLPQLRICFPVNYLNIQSVLHPLIEAILPPGLNCYRIPMFLRPSNSASGGTTGPDICLSQWKYDCLPYCIGVGSFDYQHISILSKWVNKKQHVESDRLHILKVLFQQTVVLLILDQNLQ